MTERLFAVITTIQSPTPAMHLLVDILRPLGIPLIAVGDSKGPAWYDLSGAQLLSLDEQIRSPFRLGRSLPTGHYARKNIGYLYSIAHGATCIYETDDDNAPLPSWVVRSVQVPAVTCGGIRWVNAYQSFSDKLIWPRGFPLDLARLDNRGMYGTVLPVSAPVQQGLANGSPDVDAVWRLVLDESIEFFSGPSLALAPGSFCPFNSQSTWWWKKAFPLMYLPSQCSFRMTDIWRSFVVQRCLWEMDERLVFHGAEVFQDRNEHNLLSDFSQEIPGYLRNGQIIDELLETSLRKGLEHAGENLLACYEVLIRGGHVGVHELDLLYDWLDDIKEIFSHPFDGGSPALF